MLCRMSYCITTMYLWTSCSFQIVWDENGGSTSRKAGATTPSAKRAPECYRRYWAKLNTRDIFLWRVKKTCLYQGTAIYHSVSFFRTCMRCMSASSRLARGLYIYLLIDLPVFEGWVGGVSNILLFLASLVGETKASQK